MRRPEQLRPGCWAAPRGRPSLGSFEFSESFCFLVFCELGIGWHSEGGQRAASQLH